MRIIGGHARGRRLKVPQAGTRPTSDRVRESLFSTLDSKIRGAGMLWQEQRVADLFAGSGALGLEAMSRGAQSVVFVEKAASACTVIKENCELVGVIPTCRRMSASSWVESHEDRGESFSLVFLDPPYAMASDELTRLLAALSARLSPQALVVVERPRGDTLVFPPSLQVEDERTYGDTSLWYGRAHPGVPHAPSAGQEPT